MEIGDVKCYWFNRKGKNWKNEIRNSRCNGN